MELLTAIDNMLRVASESLGKENGIPRSVEIELENAMRQLQQARDEAISAEERGYYIKLVSDEEEE